ncbi:pumilio homolog 2-like [Limulus polyphemus]|uniref:Pumilio homolog 2-like n=1 Tax=Limulus polyphemus TaxID=6850 RepID=A0ABM1BQJ2_LIMPO|nr:pumilio homolog 2-like [Limulus polyphemus]
MNDLAWEDPPNTMIPNGQAEMNNVPTVRQGATRSQDDAMVGYFFQRPQTDPTFQNFNKQSRWALGDDSVLEVRANDGTGIENEFQALALETSHPPLEISSSKKLPVWSLEDSRADDGKGFFVPEQWRTAAWSTGQNSASSRPALFPLDHAVSQPMIVQRRSGSYPGSDANSALSPRSSDTGGLEMKMVEYVLGISPNTKDLDARMAHLHMAMNSSDGVDKAKNSKHFEGDSKNKDVEPCGVLHANGIIQNGLDDDKTFNRTPGTRQASPSEEHHHSINDITKLQKQTVDQLVPHHATVSIHQGTNSLGELGGGFEHVGIGSLPFDYPSNLMQSMESSNIMEYDMQRNDLLSQAYQQRNQATSQGQSLPMMTQQQFPVPSQQQQPQSQSMGNVPPPGAAAAFASNPYLMNQDPFAMGTVMPGPAMMPQYYGMPSWGMIPTPGLIQSNQGQPQGPPVQQQILQRGGARPITPQGNGEPLPQGGGSLQGSGGQYQMLAPPYYDQNTSLMNPGNARGMGAGPTLRLMPSAMLVNPAAGPAHNPGQLQNPAISLFSTNNSNAGSNSLGTSTANATLGYNQQNAMSANGGNQLGFSSGLGLGLGQTPNSLNYGTTPLGPIGSAGVGGLGSGLGNVGGSPRRDMFDHRDTLGAGPVPGISASLESQYSRHMAPPPPKSTQFYGALGTVTASPGPVGMLPPSQSLTPPPSFNNNSATLNLGVLGGRMLSAAPGAEAKYLVRSRPLNNNGLSSTNTLFPNRSFQRNSNIEKPTGRSRLLEDFRNNRYPNLQLRDLANHIVEFSQDQHGSRFIQQKLERTTPAEKQMVFNEILGAAYSLMTDVFGNYVIQKFFEFGTSEQKQALALKVKGHVLPLALQMYGCRVIQKALESIPPEQQREVVKELDGHVLKCVKDQNGNHVVQKCIECVDPHALQFIINAFQGQVFSLSTHPYGCRVIQRILEHCTSQQTMLILEELHQHTEQLVQDQYGNYVIQHVLEHGCPEDKSKIVSMVRGKVLELAQHKFASNVVEKCVSYSSRAEKACLIEEVCTTNDGPYSALHSMMKDQYANYVIQKMIEVAEPAQRKLLLHKIRPHIPALRKYVYGKHILAKLEKYLMKNSDLGPIGPPPNGTI